MLILILQVKIQGQNEEMLLAACEQFLGKNEDEITQVSLLGYCQHCIPIDILMLLYQIRLHWRHWRVTREPSWAP